MKVWKRKIIDWLVIRIIYLIIRLLAGTIRWQFPSEQRKPEVDQCIICCWHARLLMVPYLLRGWTGPLLISEHRDGELIASALGLMGFDAVRGSSSRGGVRAMRQLLKLAKAGRSPGITPDGPRGPREMVQAGAVQVAARTGLPIVPVCYASKSFWRMDSWDRFYIPKPFTQGVLLTGDAIDIDAADDLQVSIAKVQQAMDAIQIQADQYYVTSDKAD